MHPLQFIWKRYLDWRISIITDLSAEAVFVYTDCLPMYVRCLASVGKYCISPRLLALSAANCQYYFLSTQAEVFD